MNRLIYHSPESRTSPFDEAAIKVARSGPIRIVSPYIGVGYLERLIGLAGEWSLITDVEAWLGSLSFRARPRAWSFIRDNLDSIHHCPSIHAKLVLSDSLAMMGSANLTNTGILGRTELGMLIEDPEMLRELHYWFLSLWASTTPPVVDETNAFVKWLDEETFKTPVLRQKTALSSDTIRIRAKLAALPAQTNTTKDVPLQLSTVAQTILVAEQKHYVSLELAIEDLLNSKAIRGFKLYEAFQFIKSGFPAGLYREIYFAILRHTANHPRSVFALDTINRLTLTAGLFEQSTRETLPVVLAQFDKFLAYLITQLSFFEPRELPFEWAIERETDVPGRHQDLLITELLDADFLVLEDLPGCLPEYRLSEEFEWVGRFNLFTKAHQAWTALSLLPKPRVMSPADQEEDDDDEFEEPVTIAPRTIVANNTELRRFERKIQQVALTKRRDRKDTLDSILATLIKLHARGRKLDVTKRLTRELIRETKAPRFLILQLLDGVLTDAPAVFLPQPSSTDGPAQVVLNHSFNWDMLEGYPETKTAWKAHLDTISAITEERTSAFP